MQLQMLRAAGIHDDNLHWETVSGTSKRRHKLELAMIDAREGDTFVTYKLDRVGRSFRDLLNKVGELEERKVGFCSLTERFDTTTPGGKFMFHMLGASAQFERDLIAERTSHGMRAAKILGHQVGKPLFFTKEREAEFKRRYAAGESVGDIVGDWGKSKQLIYSRFRRKQLQRLRRGKAKGEK